MSVARIDPERQRTIQSMTTADIARLLELRHAANDDDASREIADILKRYNWPTTGG